MKNRTITLLVFMILSAGYAFTQAPIAVYDYDRRGLDYSIEKKEDLAIADYTKAIQIEPNSIIAYHFRGITYMVTKKYGLAVTNYTGVIQIDPVPTRCPRVAQ